MVDGNSGAIQALPVEKKGSVPWVVKWAVARLNDMGYAGVKLTLKSDGEPAIVALVDSIAVSRKAETVAIRSPVRESRCNGKVERRTGPGEANLSP